MKGISVVILALVLIANAIDVKFCSKANFEGSCATKEYDSGKCEHLPARFRLVYDVNSIKIKSGFFGRCNSHCQLHTNENCTQTILQLGQSTNSLVMPFECGRALSSVPEGFDFKAVICV